MATPITDVFTLQFRSTIGTTLVSNTFHVRQNPTAGAVDAAHLTALLASASTDALVNVYKPLLTASGTLDAIVARLVHDPLFPDEPRAEAARLIGVAGTGAGQSAPTELCLVLSLGSDLAGRRYRGRVFLPPIPATGDISGEQVLATADSWTRIAAFQTELAKTMYPSGAGHYGGAWNDNDLCVYSLRARTLDVGPYYARVTSSTRTRRLHWLRSRGPSV